MAGYSSKHRALNRECCPGILHIVERDKLSVQFHAFFHDSQAKAGTLGPSYIPCVVKRIEKICLIRQGDANTGVLYFDMEKAGFTARPPQDGCFSARRIEESFVGNPFNRLFCRLPVAPEA